MEFYFRKEWQAPAAVGAISFVAGVAVGHYICNRRWAKFAQDSTETMNEANEVLQNASEIIEDSKSQLALDFAKAARENLHKLKDLSELRVESNPKNEVQENEVEANVVNFPEPDPEPEIQADDDWDQEAEEADRGPDAPYVIHREEFFAGPTGFAQTALEFFAEDGILCDDNRVPIYNAQKVVGKLEFGRGSGDSDLVYIRNEGLKAEYEITRNPGSYQVEVLGLEAEEEADQDDLRHSNNVLKFRTD